MSKKTYEAVAAVVRREVDQVPLLPESGPAVEWTSARIAAGLADVFAAENPRFDREKFLKAAGVLK